MRRRGWRTRRYGGVARVLPEKAMLPCVVPLNFRPVRRGLARPPLTAVRSLSAGPGSRISGGGGAERSTIPMSPTMSHRLARAVQVGTRGREGSSQTHRSPRPVTRSAGRRWRSSWNWRPASRLPSRQKHLRLVVVLEADENGYPPSSSGLVGRRATISVSAASVLFLISSFSHPFGPSAM